ncbi:MAG: HAD hydrolase family protein, partial [Clostridiales bacterium]|nr:HAD hydrolase family protein [Clostridiales bacterium]
DLEMLGEATYSFAVENAREEVKEKANYITDSNRNHGVLKVLKQVLAKIEEKERA